MLALYFMLSNLYYAENYTSIIIAGLAYACLFYGGGVGGGVGGKPEVGYTFQLDCLE